MVQKKRTYKKRAYRRRYKRTYRRRGYKRRFYKPIKKPEIHILENSPNNGEQIPFNNSTFGMGKFQNLTYISSNNDADMDNLVYKVSGKAIEGKKIRLKYLYIKGYINVLSTSDEEDFNCKLMVFRWKRNTANNDIQWKTLMNNVSDNDPTEWGDSDRLKMMYMQDWKNDIKVNFYKKVKNLYRKYDDANNIIPFKIRIPLYDCVLTCDSWLNQSTYTAQYNPSTNGLYFTFLSNKFNPDVLINYKYKLYYTDY